MAGMDRLGMDPYFAERFLNEGFSGGEKKRNEILQMAIIEPEIAIRDETDSGLDIDALKIVAYGVQEVSRDRPELGVVAITHYQIRRAPRRESGGQQVELRGAAVACKKNKSTNRNINHS